MLCLTLTIVFTFSTLVLSKDMSIISFGKITLSTSLSAYSFFIIDIPNLASDLNKGIIGEFFAISSISFFEFIFSVTEKAIDQSEIISSVIQ